MAEEVHGKSPRRDPAQDRLLAADQVQRENPNVSMPRGGAGTANPQTGTIREQEPQTTPASGAGRQTN